MILKALLFRPLMRRPWRFLVTVAGVATGVAAVISTVAASRAAVASFAKGIEEVAGITRLEMTRPGGLPEGLVVEAAPVAVRAQVQAEPVRGGGDGAVGDGQGLGEALPVVVEAVQGHQHGQHHGGDDAGHMVAVAGETAAQEGFAETGYRTVMNCNEAGGQTVFHIHLHLLGGRMMHWPPG